ncbi:IS3 family transposase [Metalysinibacillus jejuensis]|uniref:IS3 family transposase n=1 Tax=Metalysinibacillus jejuensis TaxID=914327 RepID=UPI003D038E0B
MSKQLFSPEQIAQLQKNPHVLKVSTRTITYADAFKSKFIDEYLAGKTPRKIFEEAGFEIEMLGMKRVEQASSRWRKSYERNGLIGLTDTRKTSSGRPLKRELTMAEIVERQAARIELLEGQVEMLKKLEVTERRLLSDSQKLSTQKIFQLISKTIQQLPFKQMVTYFCQLLHVSRSGYYNYLATIEERAVKERKDREAHDLILNHRGYKKGSRSIKMTLEHDFGIVMNRKKIQRIMRKYGIQCPHRKANPYKQMAKATKEHRVVPNKLNRHFKQGVPGKVLLTDISYIPYNGKMAYLSTIKDGSTNEILAYHVSNRITLDIATRTVEKLFRNNRVKLHPEAFLHSDQGVHYTSPKFQKLLKHYKLGQSMSRRGNCWDNAPQESFFGHFKDQVDFSMVKTLNELRAKIDHYMVYYNNYRYQWNLKRMAPVQYRNHLLVA